MGKNAQFKSENDLFSEHLQFVHKCRPKYHQKLVCCLSSTLNEYIYIYIHRP